MPTAINSGQPHPAADRVFFNGAYRLLEVRGQSKLVAAYTVADEIGDEYVLVEFLNTEASPADAERGANGQEPIGLAHFLSLAERLSRLRHPNIEPITQVFEDNGTGYALIEARAESTLAELLAEDAFFFQPAEVLQAAEDLLETMAYIEALDLKDFRPDTTALGFDNEGRLTLNTATSIERMLFALEGTPLPPVKYQTAACLYALLSGTEVEARSDRIALAKDKKKDGHVPLAKLDLPYPAAFCRKIDAALDLRDREPDMDVLAWSKSTRDLVHETAPDDPAGKGGRSAVGRVVTWTLPIAVLLGAGWYAFQGPDQQPSSDRDIARASVAGDLSDQTSDQTSATDETKIAVAPVSVPVSVDDPAQPETSGVPQDEALADTADDGVATPAEPLQVQPTETASVSDEAETPKRGTAKQEDLTAIFQALAGQDTEPADPAGTEPTGQASSEPVTSAVETEAAPLAPTGGSQAVEPRANVSDADLVALLREEVSKPDRVTAAAPQTLPRAAPDLAPGWVFSDQISYEIVSTADGASVLKILSVREQFSFVAKNPWYFRDVEIHSVAGEQVGPDFSLEAALARHFVDGTASTPLVDITVSEAGRSDATPARLDVPIEYRDVIGDIELVQRGTKSAWQLHVADAAGHADVLSEGDVVLGASNSGTEIRTLQELQDLIDEQRRLGQPEVALRVKPKTGQVRTVRLRSADL